MSTNLKPQVTPRDNIQGNPQAVITLVEYGDYQCPHCGHAYPIIKQLQEAFKDQLKLVFRNFPLRNIHPLAESAAIAAEAAGRQDRYWEMHDVIFERQRDMHGNSFREFAQELGLNVEQFEKDSKDEDILEKVEGDFESGIMSGVNGTPTFFINGKRYNGSWEFEDMAIVLKEMIS
jgi:protein-disulfide isomerase